MSASVKIMLSYDYCHFEICKSTDDNLSDKEINDLRKDCQRLADEAVRQYKISKDKSCINLKYDKEKFLKEIKEIELKPEGERTVNELAKLKAYSDNKWEEQFRPYDYEDDDETYTF